MSGVGGYALGYDSGRQWMLDELVERVNVIEEKIQQIRGYL